jgi:AraC family L-rhamnose operon transcriptional activator RhaR
MAHVHTLDDKIIKLGGAPGLRVMWSPTHDDVAAHDHVFQEIVVVESGTCDHVTAAGRQTLRPGDIIVIRPHVWHAYENPREMRIINCLFDNSLIRRFGGLLSGVDGAFELFRKRSRRPREEAPIVFHVRPAQLSPLMHLLETIMQEQQQRRNGWESAVTLKLLEALILTARLSRDEGKTPGPAAPVEEPALPARTDQAVMDCVTLLENSYERDMGLSDLARKVHLSAGHLSRAFSKRMGMGIVEYVHHLRSEEACRLLRWTDEPIKSIAQRVGYGEIAYFSRCFKAAVGQPPREYRKTRRHVGADA